MSKARYTAQEDTLIMDTFKEDPEDYFGNIKHLSWLLGRTMGSVERRYKKLTDPENKAYKGSCYAALGARMARANHLYNPVNSYIL
jgi:tRNA G10  N-methylase Trm11